MEAENLKETDLLFALARTPLSDDSRLWIRSNLAAVHDWPSLLSRAEQWRVEPVVFQNLRLSFPELVPEEVLANVTSKEREARARALTRTLIIVQLLGRLEAIGVPVILLKGPAVAVTAYGDASLRSFGDADLLVKPEDLARTRDFLLAGGFVRDYEPGREAALVTDGHALEFSSSSLKLELHWTLFPRYMQLDFDLNDLWASSKRVRIAESDVRVLSRATEFLFLCGHGAKHEWMSARWIIDVAQATAHMDQEDADATVKLARNLRARRLLSLALSLARDCASADVTVFRAQRDVPDSKNARLAKRVRSQIAGLAVDVPEWLRISRRLDPNLGPLIFWVQCREQWKDRAACVAHVLFVPTERDGQSGIFRWFKRPARLAKKAIGRLA